MNSEDIKCNKTEKMKRRILVIRMNISKEFGISWDPKNGVGARGKQTVKKQKNGEHRK